MRNSPRTLFGFALLAAVLAFAGNASAQLCPSPPVGVTGVRVASPSTDLAGGTSFRWFGFVLRGPVGFTIQGWGGRATARPAVPSSAAVLRERRGWVR